MFNDWQEMSLKKDIEGIIKRMDSQKKLKYTMCWEITVTIATLLIEEVVGMDICKNLKIWFLLGITVLPVLIVIAIELYHFIKKILAAKKGILSVREFIDIFDNQVGYWVMMSNSYGNVLSRMSEYSREESVFIYQEGCYYNNKAMDELYKMKPIIDKVFSDNQQLIKNKKLIDVHRLYNTFNLIKRNNAVLEKMISAYEDDQAVLIQKKINQQYISAFDDFKIDVQKCFNVKFE